MAERSVSAAADSVPCEVAQGILRRCVSVDLEIHPSNDKILGFAAVNGSGGSPYVYRGKGDLRQAFAKLDEYAAPAEFLLGHNLIQHDFRHLQALDPDLALLRKPCIDTLWLNPLSYPRNPYHYLVKHYQNGRLEGGHKNDPELDARLVLQVLSNQLDQFGRMRSENPALLAAYHWLAGDDPGNEGFDRVFGAVRGAARPTAAQARAAVGLLLAGNACMERAEKMAAEVEPDSWSFAFALAWLSVAGGDSVIPPWVHHQFARTREIVRALRDSHCSNPDCAWCGEHGDPRTQLRKWFGFDGFRATPTDADGAPLQEEIVRRVMAGDNVLGIMPTGSGKSICYQLPALTRYQKIGALTVVISPLVALMADQIASLQRSGIAHCVTVNGMLSLPERSEALEQIRMGGAAILLISPEQLRTRSIADALRQREIGHWVLDEAHCLSKWGHDFRPDYRYIARFIRQFTGEGRPAPVVCLTATAKPEVIRDIREHFESKLGMRVALVDGGVSRENLQFHVVLIDESAKNGEILRLVKERLPPDGKSGAIVYCSTRKLTEDVAAFLQHAGLDCEHYHAGVPPDRKREIQARFGSGDLRVIAATNAFGMGIDKPDIRLVVHRDMPASLENYIQEAGRAGRDREPAQCVLMFCESDIDRQFRLSARQQLAHQDITAVLKALRRHNQRTGENGEVIMTTGEILREDEDREFSSDSTTDDTRVRTAVSWLEESGLTSREENQVQIFPSSLKVRTAEEARAILDSSPDVDERYAGKLMRIVGHLLNSDPDEGVSTDKLAGMAGMSLQKLRKALRDLERLGIAANDTVITMFVHYGVPDASLNRYQNMDALEASLIERMGELHADADVGDFTTMNLRLMSQEMRERRFPTVRPDIVERLVRSIARDGRGEDGGSGSLWVRKLDREHLHVKFLRTWDQIKGIAERRRIGAGILARHLVRLARERNLRGKDLQVETTLGKMTAILESNFELQKHGADRLTKLLERALLWLHEQEVLTLGRGLTVFRQAMRIVIRPGKRAFTGDDYRPLEQHYARKTEQIHIMEKYARLGLESIADAERLVQDYFGRTHGDFVERWMPGGAREIQRPLAPEAWKRILTNLNNRIQERIVSDPRKRTNVLVLAGPGSGKTRVMVHRIAYLLCAQRENPLGILALAYNRHAATEIRRRLRALVGNDARGVTVLTCHGFAMRIVGLSFRAQKEKPDDKDFRNALASAISLLNGDGLLKAEADAQRESLMRGYRWILVDEYQDIGKDEYDLISAIAGRTEKDPDSRLGLFAIGDDDQNIYEFKGASVEYIRRFTEDYKAKPEYLTENYRSTANIISAANRIIAPARDRMKADYPIRINEARRGQPPGGTLEQSDPAGRGKVQIIPAGNDEFDQAEFAGRELERQFSFLEQPDWAQGAVIAREWKYLHPVRSYCEARGIPVQTAGEKEPDVWILKQTRRLIDMMHKQEERLLSVGQLREWLGTQPNDLWNDLLLAGTEEWIAEVGEDPVDRKEIAECIAEWAQDCRMRPKGLQLLTAHRAKGLEFEDVVVLDGGWGSGRRREAADDERRLFYVAMTRAKRSLSLMRFGSFHPFLKDTGGGEFHVRRGGMQAILREECRRKYTRPGLDMVDLSYAGRLRKPSKALAAVARIKVGDRLDLTLENGKWRLKNDNGITVGNMAARYSPPKGMKFHSGKVCALVRRFRSQSDEEFRDQLVLEHWDVVVPELVFVPAE